jgi:hypothetical protein
MLRGLSPKYGHTISSITSKDPLPSFLQSRSTLLLEEFREEQSQKARAAQAMYAAQSNAHAHAHAPSVATGGSTAPGVGGSPSSSGSRGKQKKNKGCRGGRSGSNPGGGGGAGGNIGIWCTQQCCLWWRPGELYALTAPQSFYGSSGQHLVHEIQPMDGDGAGVAYALSGPGPGVLGPRPEASPHEAYAA